MRLLGCFYITVILAATAGMAQAQSKEALQELVVEGILANNSQIADYSAKVKVATISEGVSEPKTTTVKTESGATMTRTIVPRAERTWQVFGKGDKLRFNSLGGEKAYDQVFVDGEWTVHEERQSEARILPGRTAPPGPALDLPEYGSLAKGWKLADFLSASTLVSADLSSDDASRVVSLVLDTPDETRAEFTCASEFNFMPVAVAVKTRGGVLLRSSELTYSSELSGAVWFLKSARTQFYGSNEKHVGTETLEVFELKLNSDMPDDVFALQLPDGTRVVNFSSQSTKVVGESANVPRPLPFRRLLMFCFIAVVCVFVAGLFLRQRSNKS